MLGMCVMTKLNMFALILSLIVLFALAPSCVLVESPRINLVEYGFKENVYIGVVNAHTTLSVEISPKNPNVLYSFATSSDKVALYPSGSHCVVVASEPGYYTITVTSPNTNMGAANALYVVESIKVSN
jgi:hypothetical protein